MVDLRKDFEKETGNEVLPTYSCLNSYIKWLESRVESQQDRIRELEAALDASNRLMKCSIDRIRIDGKEEVDFRIKENDQCLRNPKQEGK